jgi:hypothetical protein
MALSVAGLVHTLCTQQAGNNVQNQERTANDVTFVVSNNYMINYDNLGQNQDGTVR